VSLLDGLTRGGSTAIFERHLAEEVPRFVETSVRVDGIEAQGLDGNNNLIVGRNPRYNYLAKSTSELVINQLARFASNKEGEFYSRLLQKFLQISYLGCNLLLRERGGSRIPRPLGRG